MSSAQESDDALLDEFLERRGHDTAPETWDRSYNKKQCPDCGGLHETDAVTCSVCGWSP
ncbi:HVO_0416 family zinc finger protein [Halospeciosus flavus]|uniref:HVO_0416 family zinc finger protein n=1 Tax=Halospeciosus flavus TaxID=3032283 RepID=A0ABD5Z6L8_9EURY|nr:HVO_0416 family zinc finger protein [Halospeciosus flavus]